MLPPIDAILTIELLTHTRCFDYAQLDVLFTPPMILGLGTDLVEPARLAAKLARSPALRAKLFAPAEIAYCERMAEPAQHYAARFAAKEALLKALGLGLAASFDLHEAAIAHDEHGAPHFKLAGELARLVQARGVARLHLSISHIHSAASAVVILEA